MYLLFIYRKTHRLVNIQDITINSPFIYAANQSITGLSTHTSFSTPILSMTRALRLPVHTEVVYNGRTLNIPQFKLFILTKKLRTIFLKSQQDALFL